MGLDEPNIDGLVPTTSLGGMRYKNSVQVQIELKGDKSGLNQTENKIDKMRQVQITSILKVISKNRLEGGMCVLLIDHDIGTLTFSLSKVPHYLLIIVTGDWLGKDIWITNSEG